jgi:AhpD family alkylhydroperoxidase
MTLVQSVSNSVGRAVTDANYTIHTAESAPDMAGEGLRSLQAAVGLVPNLAATMAESPALLGGFLALRQLYAQTEFSGVEVQLLSLTAAYENDCAWCVAFHSAMGLKEGLDRADVDALRQGGEPADPRLAALSRFARVMIRKRGDVDTSVLQAFFAAGYSKRQALDVVMSMAFSLMANYAAHLTHPPLDEFLTPLAWTR